MNLKKAKKLRRIAGYKNNQEVEYDKINHRVLTSKGVQVRPQYLLKAETPKAIYRKLKIVGSI